MTEGQPNIPEAKSGTWTEAQKEDLRRLIRMGLLIFLVVSVTAVIMAFITAQIPAS